MDSPPDLIAIGDTVVDEFILLKDAAIHCNINRENCEICLRFADKVPFEAAYLLPAVGNSANAAVAAARLGLRSALVTNLGADGYGEDCLRALRANGVETGFAQVHADHKTNHHYVLWYEDDRTILIKHEKYPYRLPDLGSPQWLYLSSLGENSVEFHRAIADYLNAHPTVKLAFQPGTFQIKMGAAALAPIYERAAVFFCNKEEAQRILATAEEDVKKLIGQLNLLGPKIVVVTDGKEGAYVLADGAYWFMPSYPDPQPPFERTGAGDAFSSTFTAALAYGLPIPEALRWAPINSMSVVQYVGAQEGLLTKAKLTGYLAAAPADYAPRRI